MMIGRHPVTVVRMSALINQLLNNEFIVVHIIFLVFIYGIRHGFYGAQHLLVMDRHFNDIL